MSREGDSGNREVLPWGKGGARQKDPGKSGKGRKFTSLRPRTPGRAAEPF